MAEARVGEEEESLRESGGGGGARRNPRSSGNAPAERADRNKPEQRLSTQGALSSIRAAIKRTSTRPVPPEQNRERRRPQITIVAAEPLASNAWFPSSPGAFPAAPPPPPQPSWTGAVTVQLPPPSYEQVIREKSREQSASTPRVSTPAPPFTPSSSSSSPPASHLTATISTQTEPEASEPPSLSKPQMRRPPKPPRPTFPGAPKTQESSPAQTTLIELDEPDPPCAIRTQTCPAAVDLLGEPLSEQFGTQTDFDVDSTDTLAPLSIASSQTTQCPVKQEVSNRPKPRPRSKAFLQPVVKNQTQDQQITRDVKVQTLVRLKDDSAQSVFASFTESPLDVTTNKYLLDLLDVFGCDKQEFQHEQQSVRDQSDKSEKEEDGILKSQLESAVASEPVEPPTRPEPRPRTQNPKPAILSKPTEQTQVALDKDFSECSKRTPSPPVPVPRPMHKATSISQQQESKPEPSRLPPPPRPPTVVRRSGTPIQTEATESDTVPSPVSIKKNADHQDKTSSNSSTSAKQPSVTSSNRTGYKRSAKTPPQRRPPPPTRPFAEDSDVSIGMERTSASSVPSLPPRPSEGRVLPFRPPPVKATKPTSSSQSSVPTNRDARVPKRGPPLPPRPTPGHPLYRDHTSKAPQGIKEVDNLNTKPEEPDLQKEDLLLVFEDEPIPTQSPSLPEENGQCQNVPASTSEKLKQKQGAAEQTASNTRFKARFAFEGEEGELTLCEGDVILLLEYLNEEWARGSLNGHTGIFPLNFVQEIHDELEKLKPNSTGRGERRSGRAMYDFSPETEDELCLKVGDVVCYLEEVDDEWFVGEFAGRRGIVPKNFIQVL